MEFADIMRRGIAHNVWSGICRERTDFRRRNDCPSSKKQIMNLMISNLAFIHPEAKIGKDVIIEPFAYVAANVTIDEGTWVGPNSTIMDGARIGKKCRIFPSAVVSGIPQDLKFRGEESTVEIGDNTTIRECATVNRGTAAVGKTIVGDNCLLMAYSHIGHDCFIGNNVIVGNSTLSPVKWTLTIGQFLVQVQWFTSSLISVPM